MWSMRASVVFLTAVVSGAGVAAAQTPGSPSGNPVAAFQDQIEVVVTKTPEAPHDVPAAIEIITGDQIRALGATTLADALGLAAGVAVAPGGDAGPAGSVPEFWGLREFDAFLLVVDDVPLGGAFNPAVAVGVKRLSRSSRVSWPDE